MGTNALKITIGDEIAEMSFENGKIDCHSYLESGDCSLTKEETKELYLTMKNYYEQQE